MFRSLIAAVALVALPAAGARAQTFLTQEEALELAFPEARVERRTAYLGEEELGRAAELAGEPVEASVVTYYVAFSGDETVGAAYFDAHRVRTLDEVLMVVVDPGGRVDRVEVLRFAEPPDYLAPGGWLEQFVDRGLGPDLSVGRGIVNMTGATLTSEAATAAVRRVLALHTVVAPFVEGRGGSGGP